MLNLVQHLKGANCIKARFQNEFFCHAEFISASLILQLLEYFKDPETSSG